MPQDIIYSGVIGQSGLPPLLQGVHVAPTVFEAPGRAPSPNMAHTCVTLTACDAKRHPATLHVYLNGPSPTDIAVPAAPVA